MTALDEDRPDVVGGAAQSFGVELNGLNTIHESERKGRPRDLFWPWFGGERVGVRPQLRVVPARVRHLASGRRRSSASSASSSRSCSADSSRSPASGDRRRPWCSAAPSFGVNGNRLVVGALVAPHRRVGDGADRARRTGDGDGLHPTRAGKGEWPTKVVALIVVAALIIAGGVIGFNLIMRMQMVITIVTGVLTVVYIILVLGHIDLGAVAALPAGTAPHVIGGFVFMLTGFGLGWVNAAADYSRYLPRTAKSSGVVGWTTFGSSLAPVILLIFGILLAGSSREAEHGDRHGPDRCARVHPADLVPGALRHRRGAGPRRRCGARHLLVGSRPAQRGRAGAAVRRGGHRRHPDDAGRDLRRVRRDRLHRPVPGLPHHPRRADRRLVRRLHRRHQPAQARLRREGAVRQPRPVRERAVAVHLAHRHRHGARLGARHQHVRRAGWAGRATCSGRSGWAARRATGRSPTSACWSRCWSATWVS